MSITARAVGTMRVKGTRTAALTSSAYQQPLDAWHKVIRTRAVLTLSRRLERSSAHTVWLAACPPSWH